MRANQWSLPFYNSMLLLILVAGMVPRASLRTTHHPARLRTSYELVTMTCYCCYFFAAGVVPRTYTPVAHEDDLFLPTRHMGNREVRACNASALRTVNGIDLL
jgi:hypothetical protein